MTSHDINDGGQSSSLVGFVRRVKALADEIGELQGDIADVLAEAKGAGFDRVKIREVVRWLRKIDRHGRDKMDEAEAIFDLYRSVVTNAPVKLDEIMATARDRALLKQFAGEAPAEQPKLSRVTIERRRQIALAELARRAREG